MTVTVTLMGGETVEIEDVEFPLTLVFDGKKYVIRITKHGKLVMQ